MVLTAKALATDFTAERTLVGVGAFMYHQVVRFGELSLTGTADELLTLSEHCSTHQSLTSELHVGQLHLIRDLRLELIRLFILKPNIRV